MKSFYDVQQVLKRFGTFIYTRSRETDIMMMEEELHELYNQKMIERETFLQGLLILKSELRQVKEKEGQ
ncbi:YqgQ family protein [Bacillus alkalicellulosilyticus]|uniref:YqgQ family protein n=1 Tax=Alkalihalobacterium alkalicellulosilyticum TaxID=1912214 RepID=UPI00099709B9|nr:YqgQ family protein [Bacillus alkalicellulosilyticus]